MKVFVVVVFVGVGDEVMLIFVEVVIVEVLLVVIGYFFVCFENFVSMSGVMKEMFDCCYYLLFGWIEGWFYVMLIVVGLDGCGV